METEGDISLQKRNFQPFQDAFYFLTGDGVSKKVRGNVNLLLSLKCVENTAKEEGLSSQDLHTLCTLAYSAKFPQSVSNKLVRCLIPQTVVLPKTVLGVFSAMCTGRLPFKFKALLIRWLIVVFEYIADKDVLHSMYDVIFHFLDSDLMCPYVCRLLYLLTRKEDVQIFRVRALLQLQQRKGSESYLLGLLSVYKLYCPNFITLNVPAGKKNFFKTTDRSWILEVTSVQNKRRETDVTQSVEKENDNLLSVIHTPAHKKRRKELLPSVQPSVLSHVQTKKHLEKKSLENNNKLVPFAQIKSFNQLLQNLDRVELPSQLAVALKDQNLQHVLLCYPDPSIALRIGYWLDHVLHDEFLTGTANDKERGEELLYKLIKFSDFLQEGVPVCENFLSMYLHIWNGTDYRQHIMKLIARCRLHSFQVFYDLILEPLRKLFFCSSVYFKCEIVVCFTELLENLVMVEWPRYKYTITNQKHQDIAVTSVDTKAHNCYSVFSEEVKEFSGLQAIREFIQFADNMCHLGLQAEQDNVLLSHCVLSFFETVSGVFSNHGIPMVELCGRGFLYRHLFTNNAMLLSRMCDILIQYRKSLNDLRVAPIENWTEEEKTARIQQIQQIPRFNSYILDFCDCLWRYKAFSSQADNTVFKLLEGSTELNKVKNNHMAASFSVHSHPALLGHVLQFQKQTQPPGLKINPHQVKHHKEVYMEYLSRHRLTGITSFVQTFIKPKSGNTSTHSQSH